MALRQFFAQKTLYNLPHLLGTAVSNYSDTLLQLDSSQEHLKVVVRLNVALKDLRFISSHKTIYIHFVS